MRTVYDHGRYQCLLLEIEDMDDPIGAEVAFAGHFLDFPYDVSDGTKNSVRDILHAKLGNPDEAHFVLWDKEMHDVVGRGHLRDLSLEDDDRPEIGFFYIAQDRRGEHLVDWMYKGTFQYLAEHGYDHVKGKVEQINGGSLKAATRNGFSLYYPTNGRQDGAQSAYHITRQVPNAATQSPEHDDFAAEQRI
ncbi:MAG: hypothetical protein JKY71_02925 [Alphaproteobacteria bacterium]|nr:hypothetical protein [Alphaproteobacteria bacterium]